MATLVSDGLPFPDFATSLPTVDRASLAGLSDPQVRAWTVAKADQYHRFALALLAIHNSIAPIHRLPVELLSKVFEGCWRNRGSLRLAHICRRWRSILLRTSTFWADAVNGAEFTSGHHSLDYFDAALQRSAQRNIETRFLGFSRDIHLHLAPHVRRLVALQVTALNPNDVSALWEALEPGMSCLQTLVVSIAKSDDDSPVHHDDDPWEYVHGGRLPSLSPTAFPHLTRITAPGGLLHAVAIPSLRHLSLQRSPGGRNINYVEDYTTFCNSMENCPNLETLELLDAAPGDNDIPSEHEHAYLPVLRSLHVVDEPFRFSQLLSCLSFPDTSHIHYTDSLPDLDVRRHGLRAMLPGPDWGSITPMMSLIDRIVVQPDMDNLPADDTPLISVRCYARDEQLLRFDCGTLRYNDLAVFHPKAPVTRLELRNCLAVNLRTFPDLIGITIRGTYVAGVLDELALKDDDDRPACPGLKTLSIHFGLSDSDRPTPLGEALRDGADPAMVDAHLRKHCDHVERVLALRAEMGCRLTELEFGCVEEHPFGRIDGHERTLDLMSPDVASWRSITESLEKLVDGPVTFTGYHFYAQAPGPLKSDFNHSESWVSSS